MGWFSKKESDELAWEKVSSVGQIDSLIEMSNEVPILFFKHSTRCGVSSMALNRLSTNWKLTPEECKLAFVDILAFRDVSNYLAESLAVSHQSPQAILIKNKEVIYHSSHSGISALDIVSALKKN